MREPIDWLRVTIHFVVGAGIGGLVAGSMAQTWPAVAGGALLLGGLLRFTAIRSGSGWRR